MPKRPWSDTVRSSLLPALLLVLATAMVYGGTLGHQFLINWDDDVYVTGNEAVRSLSMASLRTAFTRPFVGTYGPLHILSYMLDYRLWGMNAAGFKLGNLLLHAANGLLFYLLLLRLRLSHWFALFAALLFIVHPVQVESVAWIAERKSVLAMFFFLLSLLAFEAYRQSDCRRWYAGAFVAGCLALLSKSVTVILPPTLLLLDLARPAEQRPRRWLLENVPFLLVALAMAVVTVKSQTGGGRVDYLGDNPLNNLMTMLPVFARYLGLFVWPGNLSAIYMPPVKLAFDGEVALAGLLFVGVVVLIFAVRRRHRLLSLGLALFLLGLAPVSHIIPIVTLMQDRYLYFPLLGLSLFVAAAMERLHGRLASPLARKLLLAGCFATLLPYGYLAWQRTAVWHDARTLWGDTVAKVPQSKEAWLFLAKTCHELGDRACAEKAYLEVLARAPNEPTTLGDLGVFYGEQGDLARSRQYLQRLVELKPGAGGALFNLGYNYFLARDLTAARVYLLQASQARDRDERAFALLVNVSVQLKQYDEAIAFYRQALATGVGDGDLEYDMAVAQAATGQLPAAMQHLREALRRGFRDRSRLTAERALAPLRRQPEYGQLLADYFGTGGTP